MAQNFSNMSHQYFYENYFLIDGKKPPPLSDFDKEVFKAYDNLKEVEQLCLMKGRGRYILLKCVQEKIIKSTPQVKIIKLNNSK